MERRGQEGQSRRGRTKKLGGDEGDGTGKATSSDKRLLRKEGQSSEGGNASRKGPGSVKLEGRGIMIKE